MTSVPFVNDGCLYLDEKTACGSDYYAYPVATDTKLATAGKSAGFTDYASFVALLNSKVNTTAIQTSFTSSYNCASTSSFNLTDAIDSLRYQTSFWCASLVLSTLDGKYCPLLPVVGTTLHTYGPLLCQSTCDAASQSLSDILSNKTVCSNSAAATAKAQNFTSECSAIAGFKDKNGGYCLPAVSGSLNEQAYCGFRTKELALKHCPALITDSCCTAFVIANGGATSKSSVASSATSSSPTTQPATSTAAPSTSTSSSPNMTLIAPLAAGGLALLVACVLSAILYARRRQNTPADPMLMKAYPGSASYDRSYSSSSGPVGRPSLEHQNSFGTNFVGSSYNNPNVGFGTSFSSSPNNMSFGNSFGGGLVGSQSVGTGFGSLKRMSAVGMSPGGPSAPTPAFDPYSMSNTPMPPPVSAPHSAVNPNQSYTPPTPLQQYQQPSNAQPIVSPFMASSSPYLTGGTFGASSSAYGNSSHTMAGSNSNPGMSTLSGASRMGIPSVPAPSYDYSWTAKSGEKQPVLLSTTSTRSPTSPPIQGMAYTSPITAPPRTATKPGTATAIAAAAAAAAVAAGVGAGTASAAPLSSLQPPAATTSGGGGGGMPFSARPPSPADTNSTPSISSSTQSAPLVMRILHPYVPTLPDELELMVGQEVVVLRAFDDGWGLGMTPSNGAQGAFPLVCVTSGVGSASESGSITSEALSSLAPEERDKQSRLSAMIQKGAGRSSSVIR